MSSKIKSFTCYTKIGGLWQKLDVMTSSTILYEQDCKSYIATSGGELLKYVDKKSKNN